MAADKTMNNQDAPERPFAPPIGSEIHRLGYSGNFMGKTGKRPLLMRKTGQPNLVGVLETELLQHECIGA